MSKKKLITLLCVGAIVALVALVGCTSDGGQSSDNSSTSSSGTTSNDTSGYTLVSDGKLTIAASLDFPPFENLENGKPVGFAVDLMGLVCDQLGLECNYLSSVKFDTIIPMVSAGGKADVGVSSFTITEDRAKEIDFTVPYCDSNQALVVMAGSAYTTADDLSGKKVGAQSGTTGYDWASENIKDADVVAFDEMTAVFAALQAGQIDAIVVDLPVAQYYVKNAYTDAQVVQEIPTGEQYGIVVSKDNPGLTLALNDAITTLKSNGQYDELYQKWFG